MQANRPQQPCAEATADDGPALPFAIVGDQAVAFAGAIQRVLDLTPIQCPRRDRLSELPGGLVQGRMPTTRWRHRQLISLVR
jgi:hypothetical protein